MKSIILLLFFTLCAQTAESTFSDKTSSFSIVVPFDENDPDTKILEKDTYVIRSYNNGANNTSIKILINRNGDENIDLDKLIEGTKAGLFENGLSIDPFKIPSEQSKLGVCFSALNGETHQITYLNKSKNNIINIILSGKDLQSVLALNEWLRSKNK